MLKRMTMVALLVGLVGFAYTTSAIAADKPVRLVGNLAEIDGKPTTQFTVIGKSTAAAIIYHLEMELQMS